MEIERSLVQLARSSQWSDRVRAGQELVAYVGEPEANALLGELLLDRADSAVTADTAESLLERGGVAAWRVFLSAWNLADPAQADHLAGALSGALFAASLSPEKAASIKDVVTLLASDVDENVRAGVAGLRPRIFEALPD